MMKDRITTVRITKHLLKIADVPILGTPKEMFFKTLLGISHYCIINSYHISLRNSHNNKINLEIRIFNLISYGYSDFKVILMKIT